MDIDKFSPRLAIAGSPASQPAAGTDPAPVHITFHIDPDRVADVLHKQASVIRSLGPDAHVRIEIRNDGTVTLSADHPTDIAEAQRRTMLLATEPLVGSVHDGTVVELIEFCGAMVELNPWHQGLLHLSKIPVSDRGSWTGFLEPGQRVKVTVIGKSVVGQLQLSMLDARPTEDAA
ncbi:MAG: hypothetical protein Q8M93_06720 [Polaromonas sp.]|uniref:hypothetical protein n=1 Tax=Polaromonas sp. TaxID=1869339 RepID=UPI002730CADA|nr:hypothetical protein [Polaromonas sp.]MDP2451088.1 hypothetical protein [Polaromonas sp.]MDP3246642.1 hypothetical protein [Polaromonas sp.]MDP3753928.1 hypothetical protein [Polaromonas sp.]